MRALHHQDMVDLLKVALSNGGVQKSLSSYEWDISGKCRAPHIVEMLGRLTSEGDKWVTVERGTKSSLYLTMLTRCRKCDPCRKARQMLWQFRAQQELALWPRTWFATLTFRPDEVAKILAHARLKNQRAGVDFDALSYGDQFLALARSAGVHLTLFLKRIRKNSGAPIRYFAVAEHHKSGMPHFHMLLHETETESPVRHAMLTAGWKAGFSQFKLVDADSTGSARYLCKYLGKSSVARVRASLDYGNVTPLGQAQRVPDPNQL